MEINKKQSRQLDTVLKQLVENPETYSVDKMQKELFPEETSDYCASLFHILKNQHPELLYPVSGPTEDTFWATDYVKAFLSQGGFSNTYDKENAIIEKNQEIDNLNLEKLKYETKNAKRIYKTYWWTFAFALIALLVSLYNFLKDLF